MDNGYGYVAKTVMVTKEQSDWIDKRDSLNFSGLIRELLQEYIDGEEVKAHGGTVKQPAQTKLTD